MDSVCSCLHGLKKEHATVFLFHLFHTFFHRPQSCPVTQDSCNWFIDVGLVQFWTKVWAHDCGKIPGYNEKYIWTQCQNKYKSQSEGTTKAEKSSRLQCSWSICFFGMHTGRILEDESIINIVQNNIYCCWKLLSALLFFHYKCFIVGSKGIHC